MHDIATGGSADFPAANIWVKKIAKEIKNANRNVK